MDKITFVQPMTDGERPYTWLGGADQQIFVTEPPEHFLPPQTFVLPIYRAALDEIVTLKQYGPHGAIELAEQALQAAEAEIKRISDRIICT